MVFGLLLIASSGVLLHYGLSEKSINQRHFLRLEAQAASEASVEYGFAQLLKRWSNQTNFASNELQKNPLTIPNSAKTFFASSNVDVTSMQVSGGLVGDGKWVYIYPRDPANLLDPQKQKRVFTRDVEVYGMATAVATNGSRSKDPVNAYCAQLFEVRDAPLFAHAIFYNMDLEFHPGPSMDIYGPVHSNSNIYVQSGNKLRFHSNLMAAGEIWHRYKPTNKKSTKHLGDVSIKGPDGNWVSMYSGSGDKSSDSSYFDSSLGDDWKQEAEDRWGGVVATKDHEVPNMRAMNIKDFVPDDPSTATDELENHAYALIEPQLPNSNPDYKGPDVQKEQFSYKAGLVLRVTEDATKPSGYDYNFFTYKRSSASQPNSSRILDSNGMPVEVPLDMTNLPADLVKISPYMEEPDDGDGKDDEKPISGFYDMRQRQGMDVVEVDIELLRKTVDSNDPSFDGTAWNGSYNLTSASNYDWNGVMYVEVPKVSSSSGRTDKVRKAKSGIAVRVKNGSVLPSPPGAPDSGFTLATNAPLYVLGNYNADGDKKTGSATAPDNGNEKPAALVADAITILSTKWEDKNYDEKSKNKYGDRDADFTEVSAAFLTGQSATIPGAGKYSGGVHNFPRFLEKWSGEEFRYRGSLVSLFQSEVNWKHMTDKQNWYSPPKRNWGFSSIFENGNFPPGTPLVRDFRRKHFRFVSKTEYAALTTKP